MFEDLQNLSGKNLCLALTVVVLLAFFIWFGVFNVLSGPMKSRFLSFPKLKGYVPPPTINEEIGLSQKYPEGNVGMNKSDSNALPPPKTLLTKYTIPQAYGESNFIDNAGTTGAQDGCRIIELKDSGKQNLFKGWSEGVNDYEFVTPGNFIDYDSTWVPQKNMKLACSPGGNSSVAACESYYPKIYKVDDNCITAGDLPYMSSDPPNPRLVSRWQVVTGDYGYGNNGAGSAGQLFPMTVVDQ